MYTFHLALRRRNSSSSTYSDLDAYDATHRGCHKFVPRHTDELFIEIGDYIFVEDEADDLWCEGKQFEGETCTYFIP